MRASGGAAGPEEPGPVLRVRHGRPGPAGGQAPVTAALDLPVAGPVSPLLSIPGLKPPAFATFPEVYDSSHAEEAIGFCGDIGYWPDPQQQLGLHCIFGRDKRGKSAAYEFAAVVPRQNLKTGLFKMAALSWAYLFDVEL